jgi:MFS family permease
VSGASAKAHPTGLVVTMLAVAGTVVSIQQTLVVPILPEFPRLLHTTPDNASWMVTATLLAGGIAIPVLSRLADMFGKKRMILVALSLMVAGSAVGALSHELLFVIGGRALQGAGLAVVPIGIAIMRDELPRDRLALGVALMSGTLAIGAGAAMPLAGVIVTHLGWHSIFWITGVACLISLVGVAWLVPESPVRSGGSFDFPGALLLSGAMTGLLLALSKGATWGWTSPRTLLLALAGVLLLALWAPLQLRSRSPLIDIRIAARPAVFLVNIASVLTGFAMFMNMLTTAQLLQQGGEAGFGLGLDAFHAGLWMAPTALVFGACAPLSAAMISRSGPALTMVVGASVMAVAYVVRVFASTALWQVVLGSVVVGIGTSLAFAAMPSLIMAAVPRTETAQANGLNTLLRSVGTSSASAAVAALLTGLAVTVGDTAHPTYAAFATAFWLAAAAAGAAGLLAVPLVRTA